jgi:large subunit ribosomal protein L18
MKHSIWKNKRLGRRKKRVRKKITGTPDRPRLTVFRSNKNIYAQIIDDLTGKTIISASTVDKDLKVSYGGNKDAAGAVGTSLAAKAVEKGIKKVAFDRNGCLFHGRIRELADAARKGGLEF